MIFTLFAVAWCCAYLWYQQFRRKQKAAYTAVYDLDNLSISRAAADKLKGTAVICGGR
jgi:hypothetical protein